MSLIHIDQLSKLFAKTFYKKLHQNRQNTHFFPTILPLKPLDTHSAVLGSPERLMLSWILLALAGGTGEARHGRAHDDLQKNNLKNEIIKI